MIKEAIDRIVELSKWQPPIVTDIGGRKYLNQEQHPVKDPLAERVKVLTLSGFRDLVNARVEDLNNEQFIVHVDSHKQVILKRRLSDSWGRRLEVAQAINEEETRFSFGSFLDHEVFMIGLQANFLSSPDRDYLLKISANLTNEQVVNSADDGISQQVALRGGVVLKSTEVVKSRVTLTPFRTFREADQPPSEFVFRVKGKEGAIPQCALFEADGGKWKIDAMQNIAYWLRDNGMPKDLPIVF